MKNVTSKLRQAGLSFHESVLYEYLLRNNTAEISKICQKTKQAKSSLYRALESLKEKKLVRIDDSCWKQSVSLDSISSLIHYIEKQKRRNLRLIQYFRSIERNQKTIGIMSAEDYVEVLNEEEPTKCI